MQLAGIAAEGQRAVANGDRSEAETQLTTLQTMNDQLAQEYDIRIVSRPDEDSGFWRQSESQPNAMNDYLVVEAVAPGGRVLSVPISSVETQKPERVNIWAQRVAKPTFDRVGDREGVERYGGERHPWAQGGRRTDAALRRAGAGRGDHQMVDDLINGRDALHRLDTLTAGAREEFDAAARAADGHSRRRTDLARLKADGYRELAAMRLDVDPLGSGRHADGGRETGC